MPAQLILPLATESAMTRGDFIEAPGNARALAFLEAWPDWPSPAAALFGPPASGKTHLAHIWAARAGASIVEACALETPPDGALVVEDCDKAPGLAQQTALFALMERATPLLLTGRTPPATWPVSLPDLASRFRALVAFELREPNEALLMALAVKLFADRQLLVPEEVVTLLVRHLERTPAAIRAFIARADAEAMRLQKPINIQLLRVLMAENGDLS
jgi:chromosomal replication initiation ATPase DnaA